MNGKVVVVTGGNAGIGLETARGLLSLGARVLLACRSEGRGAAAARELSSLGEVDVVHLDLASCKSVVACAQALRERVDKIDVLVNNAGLFLSKRVLTEDGFEKTMAVNHLGHFLLTRLVLDLLRAADGARVLTVSSDAHYAARRGVDLAAITTSSGPKGMAAYAQSKLANILFTRGLDERYRGEGIRGFAVHPGTVASEFARKDESVGVTRLFFGFFRPLLKTPASGAKTSIFVASAADVPDSPARYYANRRPRKPSAQARDDGAVHALWECSETLLASHLSA